MEQILAHLVGDYLLQPNQWAQGKTQHTPRGLLYALLHAITYTLPFLLLTTSFQALFWICFSHFIIDHFRLAKYVAWLKNWQFSGDGYPEQTPAWLRVWLMIITDNTMHLIINFFALRYL